MGFFNFNKPIEKAVKWFNEGDAMWANAKGKVVAITGCTSGIGLFVAKEMARNGAEVIMLNRASERATAALEGCQTSFPQAKFHQIHCDLKSLDSVHRAANELNDRFDKIDILFCNAGIMAMRDQPTADGFEQQMQVNHLSHFLLVNKLMPLLNKAAETSDDVRVVNHSSMARIMMNKKQNVLKEQYFSKNERSKKVGWFGESEVSNHGGDTGMEQWQRYQQTKLANVAFTYGLGDRLAKSGSKIKACVAAPGGCTTNLQVTSSREGLFPSWQGYFFQKFISQSVPDGSLPSLNACLNKEAENKAFFVPSGAFEATGPPKKVEEKMADEAICNDVWAWSCKAVGIQDQDWVASAKASS